jgi:hypothetical protein
LNFATPLEVYAQLRHHSPLHLELETAFFIPTFQIRPAAKPHRSPPLPYWRD